MSGVLDRMVKRMGGTLPSVEPLTPAIAAMPVHAAAGIEEQDSLSTREPARHQEPKTERETSNGKKRIRDSKAVDESAKQRGNASRFEETSRTDLTFEIKAPERAATVAMLAPATQAERGEATGRRIVDAAFRSDDAALPTRQDRREVTANEGLTTAIEKAIATPALPPFAKPRRDEAWDAKRDSDIAVAPDASANATQQAQPEQRTEIHISIGSVELRAPRVEARAPRPAPFRPRVTLDEFLHRKPGSGA